MNKKIYIMLSKTGTGISEFLSLFSSFPYVHASLALDSNLNGMYSFGRRMLYFPLVGGFVSENIEEGVFKRFNNGRCALFSLTVSNEDYVKIRKNLAEFTENPEPYKYGMINLVYLYFKKQKHRKCRFVCSQFVAYVLSKETGINFGKHYSLVNVEDIFGLNGLELLYEGLIREYRKQSESLIFA